MHPNTITRRELAALAGVALAGGAAAQAQSGALTARQAIERIQKNVGVPLPRVKSPLTATVIEPEVGYCGRATPNFDSGIVDRKSVV